MKLLIHTRRELIDGQPPEDAPALLLEGSWPTDEQSAARTSLDDTIDGRFDWIDRQAAAWARQLADAPFEPEGPDTPFDLAPAAHLHALALQYHLVKLLRPIVYLNEVCPPNPGDCLELTAESPRDTDYVALLSQTCRVAGIPFQVRWIDTEERQSGRFPSNAPWRRWAAKLTAGLQQSVDAGGRGRPAARVALFGNPRVLDPVCHALLARRCRLWHLYDRFAVRSWFQWQSAGVEQLVCNSSLGRENRIRIDLPEGLQYAGVSLAGAVRRWLGARAITHGPRLTRLVEQIETHFQQVRPDALVLDEDATPPARAAVAVARHLGIRTLVVQHGAPCCRFGFTPPAADRLLVWGRSSAEKLIDWDIAPERIGTTGSPRFERSATVRKHIGKHAGKQAKSPRILLLGTVPPRDERPDAIALHLTGRTYQEMLHTAFASVADIDDVELLVRPHPRAPHDPVLRELQKEYSGLRCRSARRGPLQQWLDGVDCVLSCGSSAGVEAAAQGLPVIQLAPPRATGTLPHEAWGMVGTAHNAMELQQLLARVLVESPDPTPGPSPDVFIQGDRPAADRIAVEILAPIGPSEVETKPKQVEAAA